MRLSRRSDASHTGQYVGRFTRTASLARLVRSKLRARVTRERRGLEATHAPVSHGGPGRRARLHGQDVTHAKPEGLKQPLKRVAVVRPHTAQISNRGWPGSACVTMGR